MISQTSNNEIAPCHHGVEGVANWAVVNRVGKNKWRVQCDYEDCPRSANPTSGATAEIAKKKWNDRAKKYPPTSNKIRRA